jgi:hypothetical protein
MLTMRLFVFAIYALGCLFCVSCSSQYNRCQQHYNCQRGQLCIANQCLSEWPDDLELSEAEIYPHAEQLLFTDGGATPFNPLPQSCYSSLDCIDPNNPHCRDQQCVTGYIDLDFKIGHFVVDPDTPTNRCKDTSECQAWQLCDRGYCRDQLGINSKATGKIADRGVFLGAYSFSYLIQINHKSIMRTVLVGTFSDGLQQHLHLDIPLQDFQSGTIFLDNKEITAILYDVRVEFTPPSYTPIAFATSGMIKMTQANTQPGTKVSGIANLIAKQITY